MGFRTQLKHAWNAFSSTDDNRTLPYTPGDFSVSYGGRPTRTMFSFSPENSILASIYTRLATDVASIDLRHVRLDDNGRYLEDISSGLNNCLQVEANLDQAASSFKQDMAMTCFEEGVMVAVPVDTTLDPERFGGYDIQTIRVGTPVEWYPNHVKVRLYNEKKGKSEDVIVAKSYCAIVENPFYRVMNEPNSTLKRLVRKLNLLDVVDEQSSSGKLDLIIQLPYVIKSEARQLQAEQRRNQIEAQLKGSQYGIAYTDGTEKVTQLNRPAENQLLKQVEYLLDMLYSQLGLTTKIMDGTADETTMLNYYNRTIDPVIRAIQEEMHRKFLTRTARSQSQAVIYRRDLFKLVPIAQIAEIADSLQRNESVSSNEVRNWLGLKPDKDPKSDKLLNSNMPAGSTSPPQKPAESDPSQQGRISQNGS